MIRSFSVFFFFKIIFVCLKDPEDLPFNKGDILEVISKDEEEWWTARDRHGRVGQIPVKYTTKVAEGQNGPLNNSVSSCGFICK